MTRTIAVAVLALLAGQLHAQGMDSTPAERQLRILAEMLPGHYSNANQAYFDGRRKLPENTRHGKLEISITPASDFRVERCWRVRRRRVSCRHGGPRGRRHAHRVSAARTAAQLCANGV